MTSSLAELREKYSGWSDEALKHLLEELKKELALWKEITDDAVRYAEENRRINRLLMPRVEDIRSAYVHGGLYSSLNRHPDFYSRWKGSFFDTHRTLINTELAGQLVALCDIPVLLKGRNLDSPDPLPAVLFAKSLGYCDGVRQTQTGPCLYIADPYGSFFFPPVKIKEITAQVAAGFVGHVLLLSFLIYPYNGTELSDKLIIHDISVLRPVEKVENKNTFDREDKLPGLN